MIHNIISKYMRHVVTSVSSPEPDRHNIIIIIISAREHTRSQCYILCYTLYSKSILLGRGPSDPFLEPVCRPRPNCSAAAVRLVRVVAGDPYAPCGSLAAPDRPTG